MKLAFLLECPPSKRLDALSATRCYGGGGGGSADQTQTQSQTITTTQQGVGEGAAGAFGDNSTAITVNQDVSAEAVAAGLSAAADIAATGADAAYWTGHDAQQTAQHMGDVAYWTAADAQQTAQHMGDVAYWTAADAQQTAQHVTTALSGVATHMGDIGYWTAKEGLDTASRMNAQNTGLLATLGRLLGVGASESQANMRQLAEAALDFGGNAIGSAFDLSKNTTRLVADNYTRNAEALARNYEKSVSGIADLAKSTSTGGQTEVNKSFVKIIAIVGAVLAIMFLVRK